MRRTLILTGGILLLLLIGYCAFEVWVPVRGDGQDMLVRIPEGASFDEILDTLEGAGLIRSRSGFRLLALTSGNDSKIKPGTYKFTRGIPSGELLNALAEGRSTARVKVTFPEGITVRRIASIASRQAGCDSAAIVRLANDRTFLKSIGIEASSAEGFLMPDTYFIYWGERPATILREMHETFTAFYTEALQKKSQAIGLDPYRALILASIVEGEARVADDRAIIAGVYLNRLRSGRKLQADPTIQYVLPDGPRRLLNADLAMESPYNSYRYAGLPPTPINNPGRAAIKATLNPDKNNYIFFVAKADGSGGHTFSRTEAEHARAVREYRQRVAEQRRSD